MVVVALREPLQVVFSHRTSCAFSLTIQSTISNGSCGGVRGIKRQDVLLLETLPQHSWIWLVRMCELFLHKEHANINPIRYCFYSNSAYTGTCKADAPYNPRPTTDGFKSSRLRKKKRIVGEVCQATERKGEAGEWRTWSRLAYNRSDDRNKLLTDVPQH